MSWPWDILNGSALNTAPKLTRTSRFWPCFSRQRHSTISYALFWYSVSLWLIFSSLRAQYVWFWLKIDWSSRRRHIECTADKRSNPSILGNSSRELFPQSISYKGEHSPLPLALPCEPQKLLTSHFSLLQVITLLSNALVESAISCSANEIQSRNVSTRQFLSRAVPPFVEISSGLMMPPKHICFQRICCLCHRIRCYWFPAM